MSLAPPVRMIVEEEDSPVWLVDRHMCELDCTALLLKGVEGDFLIRMSPDDARVFHLFVHVQAIPDRLQHIGVSSADGKVHSGLVKRIDNENNRILVQWVTDEEVVSRPFSSKDIFVINPRANIRIEKLHIDHQNGMFALRGARGQFTRLEDLVTHLTHTTPLSFELYGDTHCVFLNAAANIWSDLDNSTMSPTLRADLRIPAPMSSTECEELLASDNAESGDFVVRQADPRERSSNYAYAISVLGAIRVAHIGIILKDNNKLASAKQPTIQFSTLSELIDFAIHSRLDGSLLRRTFTPATEKLSSVDAEVMVGRPGALSVDDRAPWESAASTPVASAQPSPCLPASRAPIFNWNSVLKSNASQSEIDNIYGDHEVSGL